MCEFIYIERTRHSNTSIGTKKITFLLRQVTGTVAKHGPHSAIVSRSKLPSKVNGVHVLSTEQAVPLIDIINNTVTKRRHFNVI